MQSTSARLVQPEQEDISTPQHFAQVLESFLAPLLLMLDQVLDNRLVPCCVAMVRLRKSKQGLVLSA